MANFLTDATFAGAGTFGGQLNINPNATTAIRIDTAGTNAGLIFAGSSDELYIGANNTHQIRCKTNNDVDFVANANFAGNITVGSGTSTFAGDVDLPDDKRLRFGNQDLQIFHSSVGTGSFIQESGPGGLEIYSDTSLNIKSGALGENFAKFTKDGPIELYYDNSKKFETTSGGVTVTGGMSVGAINTTGTLDISSSYPRINLNDTTNEDDWSIINDDGSFSIYNVDDNVHALKINGSNDITISNDLTVSGGDIILSGTGRIQGIDTVSSSTDAVNKAYADARAGTVTSVSASTSSSLAGLSVSSGTSTPVIGLNIPNGLSAYADGFDDGSIDYSNVFVPICDDDNGGGNVRTSIKALLEGGIDSKHQFVLNSNFSDDTSTTSSIYFPFNSLADGTSSQYYRHWAAPCTGRIKRVVMQHTSGTMSSGFTTQLQIYKGSSTFATSGSLTVSTTNDGGYIEYNPVTSDIGKVSFVKGDRIRIRFSKSATGKYWRGVAASIIIELDQV